MGRPARVCNWAGGTKFSCLRYWLVSDGTSPFSMWNRVSMPMGPLPQGHGTRGTQFYSWMISPVGTVLSPSLVRVAVSIFQSVLGSSIQWRSQEDLMMLAPGIWVWVRRVYL